MDEDAETRLDRLEGELEAFRGSWLEQLSQLKGEIAESNGEILQRQTDAAQQIHNIARGVQGLEDAVESVLNLCLRLLGASAAPGSPSA